MTKYVSERKRLADWLNKVLFDIGDGEPRDFNKFLAEASLEGFKRKMVLEMLKDYETLKKIEIDKYADEPFIISNVKLTQSKQVEDDVKGVFNEQPTTK